MSYRARDQICPSWWILPVWSSTVRSRSTRRRQCTASPTVYETESQSAMQAGSNPPDTGSLIVNAQ